MATPTSTYCDYALGNDYKGATFTDGSWVSGTLTLTKAGAFAASQVNHWLYLDDNGSNEVTTGYYRITSIAGAPNAVVLSADIRSGANDPTDVVCTQAAGTTLLPWRSIQGALDLITRDATNGDQINVKAGTAQVNQAALTLARYGTSTESASLVFRGYTTAANDGGIGEIDCGGVTAFASTSYLYISMIDLEIHTFGDNNGISLNGAYQGVFVNLEIHKGASSPTNKTLINAAWAGEVVMGCYVHDAGTGGTGIATAHARYNYVYNCPNGIRAGANGSAVGNIVVDSATIGIIVNGDAVNIFGNSIYIASAGTGTGISASAAAGTTRATVINNIVEGYSGAGGKGIASTGDIYLLGYNAFYNNETPESLGDVIIDLGNDQTLISSPFVNAAGGNFALNTAVAGAIDTAYPNGAWPGLATTTNNSDMGAVQNGAGAAGGMLQANKQGNKQ